nr:PREDICTED: THAP domain-containing protein 5 [Tribolium castaneum]|eukprot:XP_008199222.1 PREDICTED: THAP domain-containing protein 5 [Tribolium castaneum]
MKREHFEQSKYSKLCSDHFKKEDFVFTFGLKTLKLGTVPTIFNFPSHLLKKEPKERSTRFRNFENDGNSAETLVEKVVTESETGASEVSVTSSSTSHQEQQPSTSTVPQETLEPQFVSKQEGTKRKRSQPIYVEDFSEADMENPKKAKLMWKLSNNTIVRQKKTIAYLRQKVYRHLKTTNKVSADCHSILKNGYCNE